MDESKIITFLTELEKLKSTLRHNWTTTGRHESSAEHTWRIAVFFIISHELFKLDVDVYKTLKMILIHDVPELKYGDIPAFEKGKDLKKHTDHKEREKVAAKEIFDLLPEPLNKDFLNLFEEYEKGESKEAKVAKALDRIESQLQHLESGPAYWIEEEKGEHMLHYPDEAVNKLGNQHISKIWALIYEEMKKLSY